MEMDDEKLSQLYQTPPLQMKSSLPQHDKEDFEYIKYFDEMQSKSLYSYFSPEDIRELNEIALDPYYGSRPREKINILKSLMAKRGFELIGGGTNRRAYKCKYDDSVVAKVAIDFVGISNNKREIVNQEVLKPFCCKVFEVSPCGTIAIVERVIPIKTSEEFKKIASQIFDVLNLKIRIKNIGIEDIGMHSFKNWGVREGFGPILLDYPTMYVMDPHKVYCCRNKPDGSICNGTLDYDDGFDNIVCTVCGTRYMPKVLAKKDGDEISQLIYSAANLNFTQRSNDLGGYNMKIKFYNKKKGSMVELDLDKNTSKVVQITETQIQPKKILEPFARFPDEDKIREQFEQQSQQRKQKEDCAEACKLACFMFHIDTKESSEKMSVFQKFAMTLLDRMKIHYSSPDEWVKAVPILTEFYPNLGQIFNTIMKYLYTVRITANLDDTDDFAQMITFRYSTIMESYDNIEKLLNIVLDDITEYKAQSILDGTMKKAIAAHIDSYEYDMPNHCYLDEDERIKMLNNEDLMIIKNNTTTVKWAEHSDVIDTDFSEESVTDADDACTNHETCEKIEDCTEEKADEEAIPVEDNEDSKQLVTSDTENVSIILDLTDKGNDEVLKIIDGDSEYNITVIDLINIFYSDSNLTGVSEIPDINEKTKIKSHSVFTHINLSEQLKIDKKKESEILDKFF